MIDRLHIPKTDFILWVFQVEQQGFIARYGRAGNDYYKQSVLLSGQAVPIYPAKLISKRVYETALRLSQNIS